MPGLSCENDVKIQEIRGIGVNAVALTHPQSDKVSYCLTNSDLSGPQQAFVPWCYALKKHFCMCWRQTGGA